MGSANVRWSSAELLKAAMEEKLSEAFGARLRRTFLGRQRSS